MYPKVILIIIIVIAVTWIMTALWPVQLKTGKSKTTIDYLAEYNRITKPTNYSPDNNAEFLYRKAFDAYVEIPDLLKDKNIHTFLGNFNNEEIASLRNWLDLNADCINFFHQASIKPYWWIERQADSNTDEITFPEIAPFKNAVYVVAWQIKFKAYDGRYKEAFEQLFDIYLASAHLASPKTLVEQLVGLASGGLSTRIAFSILNEQIDPDILKSFRSKFEICLQNSGINFKYSQGEHLYVLDAIQKCFTDNGKLIPSAFAKMTSDKKTFDGTSLKVSYPKALLISLTHSNKKDTIELTEKYHDYFNRLIKQTPWQISKEKSTYTNRLAEFVKGNYFLSFGSQKTEGFMCEIKFREQALEESLICTIAILEYKNNENKFPEKLDDIIKSGYLDYLPIDPYSGKPLVYKKTENDFILYSIGADFKDDGGIQNDSWGADKEGGDYVFWPVQFQQN